jgi:hypothetical protein
VWRVLYPRLQAGGEVLREGGRCVRLLWVPRPGLTLFAAAAVPQGTHGEASGA